MIRTEDIDKRLSRSLYAVIDTSFVPPGALTGTALKIIEGGCSVFQLRAKGAASGEFLKAAAALSLLASRHNALFVVNDRVDIALVSRAGGVHLGQDDIDIKDARRLLGEAAVIGVSTHGVDEARKAQDDGADYISFGPVFETRTKKDALAPRGLNALEEVRKSAKVPVVAIGGITEENMGDVISAGADAVAMVSAILGSGDITAKVSSIIKRLGSLKTASR